MAAITLDGINSGVSTYLSTSEGRINTALTSFSAGTMSTTDLLKFQTDLATYSITGSILSKTTSDIVTTIKGVVQNM